MNRRSLLGMIAGFAAGFRPTSVRDKPTWWPATRLQVAKDVTSEYTFSTSVMPLPYNDVSPALIQLMEDIQRQTHGDLVIAQLSEGLPEQAEKIAAKVFNG